MRGKLFLALALVLPAVLLIPVTASAGVVSNTTTPVSFTPFDPCTNEFVAITGQAHEVVREQADSSGGFHVGDAFNYQNTTGVGMTSGTHYQVTGGDWFEFNADPPFPFNATSTVAIHGISDGSTPNLSISGVFHITVNANGQTTSFVNDFEFTCQV